MWFSIAMALLGMIPADDAESDTDRPTVVVVVGAAGSEEFAAGFREAADHWQVAAAKTGTPVIRMGDDAEQPESPDRERLRSALESLSGAGSGPVWLVLIGHGTSDGRDAKFNLRGPDVSDTELASWLSPLSRPIAILDGSSSSGPFLARLSAEGRVVVTATRSGNESNYARFGGFLAAAIDDLAADLDKDGQVSLLEAFLTASARTAEFYKSKSRLATEHALLDDNGDKLGTPADWFRGVRAIKRAKDGAAADGPRAHQWHLVPSDRERALPPDVRRRRDQIELELAALRDRQSEMKEDAYLDAIDPLMQELARLYIKAIPAETRP